MLLNSTQAYTLLAVFEKKKMSYVVSTRKLTGCREVFTHGIQKINKYSTLIDDDGSSGGLVVWVHFFFLLYPDEIFDIFPRSCGFYV